MSVLLTKDRAEEAVQMIMPAIRQLMENSTPPQSDLHIVIADPVLIPGDPEATRLWGSTGIIYEESLGNRKKWKHSYDIIARSKTHLSWRYGMSSQVLQVRCPYLLQPGSTIWFGSAVSDGLVVGVSGLAPYYDQMIASWVLEACRALCIAARETGHLPNDGDFAT